MNSRICSFLQVAIAAAALGAGAQALAAQGITGKLAGKARPQAQEQRSEQGQEQRRDEPRAGRSQPQSRPAREEQPARREQPVRQVPARPTEREATPRPEPARVAPRPTPRVDVPASTRQADAGGSRGNRGNTVGASGGGGSSQADRGRSDASRGNERGLLGTLIQREYDGRDIRDRNDRDGRDERDRGDARGGDRDRDWDRDRRRPGSVVQYLPVGYRDYAWNGSRYYYHSGYWYRPYGSSYISISIPFGLFVGTLPGAYTSFTYGSTRYYYSDHHYYLYEPVRRGYVVARSPYGDDDQEYVDSRLDQDLYVYPAQGQSEQQQADDRYDCHRWAVDETGYDPIDDEYGAELRDDYLRAITACLTGRGYTVR